MPDVKLMHLSNDVARLKPDTRLAAQRRVDVERARPVAHEVREHARARLYVHGAPAERALGRLRSEYDVILIDCQPTMGQLTINALVASDEVIVPLQCEYFALHGFIELKGNIDKVRSFLNPELKLIGILATMYEKKTLHNREVLTAILEKYPEDVFETIIAKTIRFAETTVAGEPITAYASSSGGAQSYRRLARELIARGGAR